MSVWAFGRGAFAIAAGAAFPVLADTGATFLLLSS